MKLRFGRLLGANGKSTKRCTFCGEEKDLATEFYLITPLGKYSHPAARCKTCEPPYQRQRTASKRNRQHIVDKLLATRVVRPRKMSRKDMVLVPRAFVNKALGL